MNPFAKHIPSVFCVNTPFQALCAIAAIKQLKIEDYLLLVYFPKHGTRNGQLRMLLEKFEFKYKPIKAFNRITFRLAAWSSKRSHKAKYQRLFIGDMRDLSLYFASLRSVNDGSDLVYLDDGNITVSLLKDIVTEPLNENCISYIKAIESKRHICFNKNFLTVYGDIDNPKYNIETLDLSLIVHQNYDKGTQEGIYIIGTNIDRYCGPFDIPYDVYINKLEELVIKLKGDYPDDIIVFIPHGMDKSEYAKDICKKHHIAFEPSKMTVEMKLLSKEVQPKAVYGFTSSALYNIKKMYPQTRVVNVLYECNPDNPFYQEYSICSEYYLKNGIELQKEPLL